MVTVTTINLVGQHAHLLLAEDDMEKQDQALTLSNPRLLSVIYFTLLAVITTFFIDFILYSLGIDPLLPVFKKLFLSIMVAAFFSALFGERLIHCEKPYRLKVFLWGFLMAILAVPLYNLGFVYFLHSDQHSLLVHATLSDLWYIYLNVLVYSFLFIGIWIAIGAGLAAIYLRGYLVYYLLESQYRIVRHKRSNK